MTEIILYGVIGESADKCDAATVTAAIRAATGPISIRINSPGGFVIEGLAIVAALREYPKRVTCYIDGLAASMASVIACMGDDIVMAENSLLMIHKPWDAAIGHAEELRHEAGKLDRVEQQMIAIYAKRTGLPEGEIKSMLAAETWLSPEEALEKGFATSIAPSLRLAAMIDMGAYGFRRPPAAYPKQEKDVTTPTDTTQAVALERNRISTIQALCDKHALPKAFMVDLIDRGTPLDQARELMLDRLAAEGDAKNIGHRHPVHGSHTTLDNPGTYADAVTAALSAKIAGTAAEGPAAEFRGMSVVDIARDVLNRQGVRDVHRINPDRVINEAMSMRTRSDGWPRASTAGAGFTHTTSDFPDLVGAAAERYLVDRYKLLQSPLKQLARRRDFNDFLTHYGVQVDDWGALDSVHEAGEFKNRSVSTRKSGYRIETFGNMFGVSRQMLVNDGMGALADILSIMAAGAAETEAAVLAGLINGNVPLDDGQPWFHASHGNVAAGPAAADITVAALDTARQAMRGQKNKEGRIIDAAPKFLLVPVQKQTQAEVLVASTIAPTTTAEVNPFAGKLTPIADPRLSSPTAWFLFGDPTLNAALQYSYLNGQEHPFTDQQDGWRVDGTEYKVRHDFGAGVIDYRFSYKNPGA